MLQILQQTVTTSVLLLFILLCLGWKFKPAPGFSIVSAFHSIFVSESFFSNYITISLLFLYAVYHSILSPLLALFADCSFGARFYHILQLTAFFISNTWTSDVRLKLAKNRANAKLKLNFSYFTTIHFLHPGYRPKIMRHFLKNKWKCSWDSRDYTSSHNENKDENEKQIT